MFLHSLETKPSKSISWTLREKGTGARHDPPLVKDVG